MAFSLRSRALAAGAALTCGLVLLFPSPASAHSLDSSTIAVRLSQTSADATVSVALETLDEALGTDYAATADVDQYADEIIAYLDEHLTVTGADGTTWTETYTNPVRESVEGIASFSVDVALDTASTDPSSFTIAYDAIVEADPAHQAVVVLTDATGEISTAGVLTATDDTLRIGDSAGTGIADMIGYGFHHVLQGADHLLFLITLLLVAPLVVAAGRWRRREGGAVPALRKVVQVVTAFTVGHSLTLIASALGWVTLPSAPVEVLVAASVAVSALHALRPLTRHGEELIAGAFGLVHGLAFAGILTGLGLDGTPSLLALLAFNLGVELAQLATVALIFPSLYLASRTRFYPPAARDRRGRGARRRDRLGARAPRRPGKPAGRDRGRRHQPPLVGGRRPRRGGGVLLAGRSPANVVRESKPGRRLTTATPVTTPATTLNARGHPRAARPRRCVAGVFRHR
ncbi:HupE/UreJ family protein [Actinoplanes sp. ATCC 53533]|uniref:HupE/UreJ family protein n=1 Tax=Actinoplanes sp. ATCC 53533 TaxID=1288362 RepID=UPI00131548D7|nr:HupE/UreJ family protein [Actinoplanes sp. ATCC 53533]